MAAHFCLRLIVSPRTQDPFKREKTFLYPVRSRAYLEKIIIAFESLNTSIGVERCAWPVWAFLGEEEEWTSIDRKQDFLTILPPNLSIFVTSWF